MSLPRLSLSRYRQSSAANDLQHTGRDSVESRRCHISLTRPSGVVLSPDTTKVIRFNSGPGFLVSCLSYSHYHILKQSKNTPKLSLFHPPTNRITSLNLDSLKKHLKASRIPARVLPPFSPLPCLPLLLFAFMSCRVRSVRGPSQLRCSSSPGDVKCGESAHSIFTCFCRSWCFASPLPLVSASPSSHCYALLLFLFCFVYCISKGRESILYRLVSSSLVLTVWWLSLVYQCLVCCFEV